MSHLPIQSGLSCSVQSFCQENSGSIQEYGVDQIKDFENLELLFLCPILNIQRAVHKLVDLLPE